MEEDINRIYDLLQWADDEGNNVKKECKAFENMVSSLKQLKEENKKMAEQYLVNNPGVTRYLNENYIFKSKVKEKIEEYENEIEEINKRFYNPQNLSSIKEYKKRKRAAIEKKKALQELLGEE